MSDASSATTSALSSLTPRPQSSASTALTSSAPQAAARPNLPLAPHGEERVTEHQMSHSLCQNEPINAEEVTDWKKRAIQEW